MCTTRTVVHVQQLSTYKLGNTEDSSCKEEKVEDFVLKLEKVVETKVAYFYTPSPKNSKVSDHDSNRLPSGSCLTMTLTQAQPNLTESYSTCDDSVRTI